MTMTKLSENLADVETKSDPHTTLRSQPWQRFACMQKGPEGPLGFQQQEQIPYSEVIRLTSRLGMKFTDIHVVQRSVD
jgi:hypothetical protein